MTPPPELATAIDDARRYADEGRKHRPFDPVYVHTLDQLAVIDRHLAMGAGMSGLVPGEIDVGRMAAKELGDGERAFAHALHVIQWHADAITGENAQNR